MRTEEQLRSSLARVAGQIVGSEAEAWQAIEERLRRRRGPSMQRALAALVALAVAASGIGLAVWSLGRNVQLPSTSLIPERIAFVKTGPRSEPGIDRSDLFTVRPDGSDQRNMSKGAVAEGPVNWSADGSTVAFIHQSAEPGADGAFGLHTGVFVMGADGRGLREIVACQGSYGRLPCDIRFLALSPSGSQLAYLRYLPYRPGAIRSISVIRTDGTGGREIPCPQCGLGIGPLAWSPDGTRLAFGADLAGIGGDIGPNLSPLYVVDVAAGMVTKFIDITTSSPYPSWSPDGKRIALALERPLRSGRMGLSHELAVINADGTALKTILDCDQAGCAGLYAPTWSPDGTRLAFVNEQLGGGEIWIVGTDGTIIRTLSPCIQGTCLNPDRLVWSPDGRSLAFEALAANHQAWDLYVMGAGGTNLRRVAERLGFILAWLPSVRVPRSVGPPPAETPGEHASPSPYPLGLIAFAGDGGSGDAESTAIYVVDPDGNGLRRLTHGSKSDLNPAWSPDGSLIAFDRPAVHGRGIFVMNADGSDVRRIYSSPCGTVQPSWSPDGRSLAFIGVGPNCNRRAVFVMDANGSAIRQLTDRTGSTSDPAWSPDGRWIAFEQDGDLYLVSPGGTDLHRLTDLPGEESKPAWAPDGRSIAFVRYTGTGDRVYVIDADGTDLRPLTDVPGSQEGPGWAPDGRGVVLVHIDDGTLSARVEVATPDGLVREPVTPENWAVYDPVWQPAG